MIDRRQPRALLLALAFSLSCQSLSAEDFIPRRQDKPPGPAVSPQEAIGKMTVPEGFSVELVASEPDIVNPVAMTIDERGRFWITESLEYPRREPGPGRDRVKVLEDTDGDGRADKFTVFAEGLNIPSGIAVGHGGVWVANSPDILFMQDTDGDGKADKQEVVVTGFGRDDTHELPNSLTWGPDGWLYGLNGVFNPSHIKYRGKEYHFTCALFRIHPVTRDFEVFAEGTSNPWGVAWDNEGSAFVSACVIDHLWHLTESGYYHRQGGPYPPYTWKMESIVKHKHQLAAYCGLHYYDSDAYPQQYRQKLYMGNVHAGAINSDKLQRDGSTYLATPEPDFLQANDPWFMPVVQKTGPDGSLYVLDWYDRYHCYQDANRDPKGVDRLNGRLYRIRYKDTPRVAGFDLSKESDEQLIAHLGSGNGYFRDIAQRLLTERNDPGTLAKLEKLVLDDGAERRTRMHALWVLVSAGPLDSNFHQKLLAHDDTGYRAWAVRAAGDSRELNPSVVERIGTMMDDKSPDVRLQVAIAATKIDGLRPIPTLMEVLAHAGQDKVIPHIVWQNLHPLLESGADQFVRLAQRDDVKASPAFREIMPRAVERILGSRQPSPKTIAALFASVSEGPQANVETAKKCLSLIANKVQTGELQGKQLEALRDELSPMLTAIFVQEQSPLRLPAALLATTWKDPAGLQAVRSLASTTETPEHVRLQAFEALISAGDASTIDTAAQVLGQAKGVSTDFRGALLAALGKLDRPQVGELVLKHYSGMAPELKPKAIELLTQRPSWSKQLLEAIGQEKIPASALNVNQVRKLLASKDAELVEAVRARWGSVRTTRDPKREEVIAQVRDLLAKQEGDPHKGQAVFNKVCAQCHKIYGEGQEVGPDITSIGRTSMDLLLSNVLDPSLVIGAVYQATSVQTVDGRVLTGLVVENNDQRLVLKIQGGKIETIARDDIEVEKVSELSMMPEELEKQLSQQELVDLFAFLALDKPPSDPTAKRVPAVSQTPGENQGPGK